MSSFDLNNTFGALLLGTTVSSMLYGATCLQSWHYFRNYSDGPLTKYAVATLLTLESLHTAFSIHAIYYYLVLNYSHPTGLLKATWSVAAILLVTHLIRIIVEMFYVWRVYIVSERKAILPIIICMLELACMGTGVAGSIVVLQVEFFSEFPVLPKVFVRIPAAASLALSATVDILVAGSLSFYLRVNKTGIFNTDKVIDKLVVHAVNNGIITSIVSVLCVVFALAYEDSLIYLMIYQCIGHLYANTMLSTLNSRRQLSNSRVLATSIESSDLHVSGFQAAGPASTLARGTTVTDKSIQEDDSEMYIDINVHTIQD